MLAASCLALDDVMPLSAVMIHDRSALCPLSSVATIASKGRAKPGVLVRQVQDMLRQTCGLDDAAHFHGTLLFDQLPYRVQQVWRELKVVSF